MIVTETVDAEESMRSRLTVLLSSLAFAALTGAGLADPSLASEASDPSGKLALWVGRWNFSGQIYQTKYSHAHPDTGVASCIWATNKGYVICDYFSDNPPHDDLSVISYNSSAKAYMLDLIH